MFTGIIEEAAKVLQKTESTLTLERPASFDDLRLGSSIAVSGVCLSVVSFDDTSMQFDVVEETWKCTKLGDLTVGDSVNLERSLKADGRFEGHVVQGHVEGVASCKLQVAGSEGELTIDLPDTLRSFVVHKGSIAIDGVSLTVAGIEDDKIRIALIPHTLENTTLGKLQEGDCVNIETDILGRYVTRQLAVSS